ncbi:MAG: GDP-mannose-dependent alpha-(1-6)-phosphatidylinositol monomannoside mannosyltransferase [Rhizobacter sp.]|nr:GDP-mannose-dependent alpha-(1-6)-phosphatidylinositol monomannoside mannosyltransferase [Rhizobacter sp.]
MKVLLLGAGNVIHTQRWANGLAEAGVHVVCVSQHPFLKTGWAQAVQQVKLPHKGLLGYFLNVETLRDIWRNNGCQVLNAHYATGYGMTASSSGIHPLLVSVWGSDVFDFPRKSPLHAAMVRRVLRRADAIGSTSAVMALQVKKLLGAATEVVVTPFGVDTSRFTPLEHAAVGRPLVIGTVKTLAPKYGIDTLIRAFALIKARLPSPAVPIGVRLRLVGDGPQRYQLESLAQKLGVADWVEFTGAIDHAEVPKSLRRFDIFAAASRLDSESFGVAVIEASASGLPVVVTQVGGLPEVVEDGKTGFIVPRNDPKALADALWTLCGDAALRRRFGAAGRAKVQAEYEWRGCVTRMVDVFRALLAAKPR